MAYDYSKLQNGSDIRGIAIGSPAEPVNLDSEAVSRLAKGFLYLLSHSTDKEPNELCIAVGRDSRISGPELVRDIVSALTPYGAKVLDFHLHLLCSCLQSLKSLNVTVPSWLQQATCLQTETE